MLELIPAPLAQTITRELAIPTIGIGAGPFCDGQVQVVHDLLGLNPEFQARHVRRYAALAETIREALAAYSRDVRDGSFPGPAESFGLETVAASSQPGPREVGETP